MFLNAMYGGLGQSLGAIVGGKLQHMFGTVWTFIYSGLFDTVFVGLVIVYLRIRKDSSFKNPQQIIVPPSLSSSSLSTPTQKSKSRRKEH
jgi:branched-subunit amino acid ABC-type transport system permease component